MKKDRRRFRNPVLMVGILFSFFVPLVSFASQDCMTNYFEQPSYSGDCTERPPGSVCIGYSDNYTWLIYDSITGWREATCDGNIVQVAVGINREYHHILDSNSIAAYYVDEAACMTNYFEQPSYSGDCSERPPGSVCIGYSDNYTWLIYDSITGWREATCDGNKVQVAVGINREYHHILDSNFVRAIEPLSVISAIIDVHPDTINLKSKGRYITCYIELPASYDVNDIDTNTIFLNIEDISIPVELRPSEVGDYNNNGVLDLMVKFDRQIVQDSVTTDSVEMVVSGFLINQEDSFEGTDIVLIVDHCCPK
ncbi:hypothetical protein [Desulfosarcina ovata]|uniref:Uncharacterized protein n=1 Tax=Desulfosarcina ovata subsp. ovata TaxID=2752305 RepID=A0A5K8A850_9BACT|nr:hypothetical protein [Desulfosarcina ovata]BBO88812.1 hypothetical protein DSCOOX_19920 [Desulfosarcina ovata subsp. ovata]